MCRLGANRVPAQRPTSDAERRGFRPLTIGVMSKTPRIEIFRTGTHTSVEGTTVHFGIADLQAAVDAYDFASDPAPIVVGHPKMDAPAYGWAERLELDGETVVAIPRDVEPSFAEAVNAGRYKKVSASWYPSDHPSNPKPGSLYLRHIGFLGAHPPAVKGLAPVSFSEAQQAGCITVENPNQETFMGGKADEKTELSFAERVTALDAREQAIKDREDAAAKAAQAAQHASNLSFAEAQVAAGLLLPAGKDLAVLVMDDLESVATISFGEGDGKVELTPNAAFRKLFDQAVPMISFGERAPGKDKPEPMDSNQLALKAQSYMEGQHQAGNMITIAAAVRHIEKVGAA